MNILHMLYGAKIIRVTKLTHPTSVLLLQSWFIVVMGSRNQLFLLFMNQIATYSWDHRYDPRTKLCSRQTMSPW